MKKPKRANKVIVFINATLGVYGLVGLGISFFAFWWAWILQQPFPLRFTVGVTNVISILILVCFFSANEGEY